MSLEEATISNMWEIAALVELLERKGMCTKHDLFNIITELAAKCFIYKHRPSYHEENAGPDHAEREGLWTRSEIGPLPR
jgi:hypothetical protein